MAPLLHRAAINSMKIYMVSLLHRATINNSDLPLLLLDKDKVNLWVVMQQKAKWKGRCLCCCHLVNCGDSNTGSICARQLCCWYSKLWLAHV